LPREVAERVLEVFSPLGEVLGLFAQSPRAFFEERRRRRLQALPISLEEIERLVAERAEARRRKDWARADRIRDQLASYGIRLQDTPEGTRWDVT